MKGLWWCLSGKHQIKHCNVLLQLNINLDYSDDYGSLSEKKRGSFMSDEQTIKASEFKAKCLKLMDEVATSGED